MMRAGQVRLFLSLLVVAGCQSGVGSPVAGTPVAPAPAAAPSGPGSATTVAAHDSVSVRRDSMAARALRSIAGREQQPAESVYRNIKVFKTMPAGRLIRVMNDGFGRSLGVTCTHCHVPGRWASDEKPQKQIARDMIAMVNQINTQLLPKIPNLKGPEPGVSCATCHRGMVKPARSL
jgi:hypothetical protein